MPTGFLLYRKSIYLIVILAIAALIFEVGRVTVAADIQEVPEHRKQEQRFKSKERRSPAAPAQLAGRHRAKSKHAESARRSSGNRARTTAKPVKTLSMLATGYTAGIESTGKKPGHPLYGITRSGVKVKRDQVSTVAADTAVLPIGSLLYIPGYGYGVVADTGSKIKGNRIDLYFDTTRQVYKEWGKKQVNVKVIKMGSGRLDQHTLNRLNDTVKTSGSSGLEKMKL